MSKTTLTQFGRALRTLGIQMIPAYSPEERGRSKRALRTHQDRHPKGLAAHGISRMDKANSYLIHVYQPAFNAEFMRQATSKEQLSYHGLGRT